MNKLLQKIETILNAPPASPETTVLESALPLVLAHFNSETGTIHLLDDETQLLHLAAQIGIPPHIQEAVRLIPVGKGIAGQAVERNGPVSICNIQTDKSGVAKPAARQTGVGGALCVPLRDHGKIVGTIGIGTVRQHEYTPAQTADLYKISSLIGSHLAKSAR